MDEAELISAQCGQSGQTILFQLHRIIIIQIVDADYAISARQQFFGKRHADEASDPGDKYVHFISLLASIDQTLSAGYL